MNAPGESGSGSPGVSRNGAPDAPDAPPTLPDGAAPPMRPGAKPPSASPLPPLAVANGPLRWALALLAIVCLALAVLGVLLPGLPTTPFLLLAAWAAARSSPRLARWLESHRLFGPLIRDWRAGGRVSRRAKWSATVAMAACAAVLLWTVPARAGGWPWAWAGVAAMALVLAWLWCRPEP